MLVMHHANILICVAGGRRYLIIKVPGGRPGSAVDANVLVIVYVAD
jgi:hypothetical protein